MSSTRSRPTTTRATEGGFAFDDPDVAIEWPELDGGLTVSERDRTAPRLAELRPSLPSVPVTVSQCVSVWPSGRSATGAWPISRLPR